MLDYPFEGEKIKYTNPCVLLLGGFDGLHVGHKKLIDCAKQYSLPLGITTMTGGKGKSVFTTTEREKIFKLHGLSFYKAFKFTDSFKNKTKEEFLSYLTQNFNINSFVCGQDFRFGQGACGTPNFILEFTGIPVYALDVLSVNGEKVSVSLIKEYLKNGQIERANALLLTPFFLSGKVEEGRKTGRTMGFPTANLSYPKDKFPLKEGVYAVHAEIDGKRYNGIANFGACPTFDIEYKKVEAYFDGFIGNLYGSEIDLYFDGFLRETKKFPNVEELKIQLQEDLRRIRE